jgi:DNA (cytosine-5)-methyltransferase 1
MSDPRILDLCCCEGGASVGYYQAGSDVYGVDLFTDFSVKRYPFPSHKGDVLTVLDTLLDRWKVPFSHPGGATEWLGLSNFAAIAASPPCQHASAGTRAQDRSKYPRLIEPIRERLDETGLPYVIENVKGAALRDPIMLCGTMFGLHAIDDDGTKLEMWRHRLFESNVDISPPGPCQHGWFSQQVAGSYGGARRNKDEARNVRHGGYVPSKAVQQKLLGIDWMTERGMHQSIPPCYTEHIGIQLLEEVDRRGQAATA